MAKTHATHKTRVSGVVVSINAKRHTLKLRLKHAAKQHKPGASARVASVDGAGAVVVAFGHATVTGPNGAVAVGDDVTVTTTGPVGQTAVATSIDVIGQHNGGDAGKGAAIPGEVTALDAANGTLTLGVTATDAQGHSQDSSVLVDVSSTTILAVGDTNGDGHITLADIAVGDHLVVFTQDASANPLAAVGILDASHEGSDHTSGGDGSHAEATAIPGTVASLDVGGSSFTLTVTDGALAGHTITVGLGEHTSFGGEDSGHDGPLNLSDVSVGDTVVVYTRDTTTAPIVAVGIVDKSKSSSGESAPSTAAGGGAAKPEYFAFAGTVATVGPTSLQVTVNGDGSLAGQTVTVEVTTTTRFKGATTGGATFTLSNVNVGDEVRLYTASAAAPLVAVYIGDSGNGSTPAPTPPSTETMRFGGVVTDVRTDGLTLTVTSGGPLSGHSVVVSVPPGTSLAGPPSADSAPETLSDIAVGDAVEVYTHSESASPVVAVGVRDDGIAPHA